MTQTVLSYKEMYSIPLPETKSWVSSRQSSRLLVLLLCNTLYFVLLFITHVMATGVPGPPSRDINIQWTGLSLSVSLLGGKKLFSDPLANIPYVPLARTR